MRLEDYFYFLLLMIHYEEREREKVQATKVRRCSMLNVTVSCFFVLSNRYLVTKNSIHSTYDMLVGAVLHKVAM